MVAFLAVRPPALLLGLLLLLPVTAQASLTLGWIPGATVLGSEEQARRLAAQLETGLAEPVVLRAFTDEAQLHQWLHHHRLVDLAPLSEDYYRTLPAGQLLPAARLRSGAVAAQLVLRQGLPRERQRQLQAQLENLPADFAAPAVKPVSSPVVPPPAQEAVDEHPSLPGDVALTQAHGYVSRNVESLARKIDTFFGADRAFEESSGTYLRARGSLIYRKSGDLDFDGNVRAKLDLPNLKEKLSLVIESDTDDNLAQKEQITTGTPKLADTFDSRKAAASLQYVLQEERFWDLRLQPGIKLHWPPETFLRLRLRRIQPISEKWLSRVTLTPGWYDPRGWEVRLRHDFDRDAGGGSLFRATSEATWLLKEDRNIALLQSFAYAHPLGNRVQMAYETGVTFETDPTFWDTAYFSSIRYRRNIHRGWVFLELKPQILFERDNDFKPDPSFALAVEIVFGAKTLEKTRN